MIATLLLATLCLTADPPLDLETLRRVVDGQQADFEDVEFLYEGGIRHVARDGPGGPFEKTYQGTFALRSDMAAAIDLYLRPRDPDKSLMRRIACVDNKYNRSSLEFRPDMGINKAQAKTAYGGVTTLGQEGSPLRIFQLPTLLYYLRDTEGYRTLNKMNYQCDGWEEVGGQRCLKVRFTSEHATNGVPTVVYYYWIDLERSGMVLQFEYHREGERWSSVTDVVLGSYPLKGGRNYWFPVRGVARFFVGAREIPAKPRSKFHPHLCSRKNGRSSITHLGGTRSCPTSDSAWITSRPPGQRCKPPAARWRPTSAVPASPPKRWSTSL